MIKVNHLIKGEYYIANDGIVLKFIRASLIEDEENLMVHFYPLTENRGYVRYTMKTIGDFVNVERVSGLLRELL